MSPGSFCLHETNDRMFLTNTKSVWNEILMIWWIWFISCDDRRLLNVFTVFYYITYIIYTISCCCHSESKSEKVLDFCVFPFPASACLSCTETISWRCCRTCQIHFLFHRLFIDSPVKRVHSGHMWETHFLLLNHWRLVLLLNSAVCLFLVHISWTCPTSTFSSEAVVVTIFVKSLRM